eukprot:TRINITY_DN75457_c0_g1_i1.p1 TRINITY_DN75457_c0_g1~~TRINITY_DN75457_c0_g1_i1.p1  ORF type:complete len:107 (+),score=3.53 TRINITY_DN75457_c0_g1_i1:76-396(+)
MLDTAERKGFFGKSGPSLPAAYTWLIDATLVADGHCQGSTASLRHHTEPPPLVTCAVQEGICSAAQRRYHVFEFAALARAATTALQGIRSHMSWLHAMGSAMLYSA